MHNQSRGNPLKVISLLITLGLLLPHPAHAQPPTPNTVWFLAEGASNSFFEEDILIGNPNSTATQVRVTLLPQGGTAIVVPAFTVPATSRYTFEVEDFLPQGGSISAVVESTDNQPIVVERTMTWPNGQRRGGHNSPGVAATAPTWYLAEGVTGFFNTFILITNPGTAADAQVDVKYLRAVSGPITQSIVVPKEGRVTIPVNEGLDLDGNGTKETSLDGEPFSTVVSSTNGVNIAVERAMYWSNFEGGHESTAVTAPNEVWLFAEGVTGGDAAFSWDTYLLLANPQNTDANVTVTFFRQNGAPLTHQLTVGANRRETIQAATLDIDNDGTPDLPNGTSFSTRVQSTNGVAIVAERAMYWSSNGITYIEGHNTPGVNAEALKWAFAEGAEGRVDESNIPYSSFFLVSNATGNVLNLKATFVREDGTGIVKTFIVDPQSRFTIPTGSYPELRHRRFAAFLESSVPFVSERAVYWGEGFYGGHASVGTPWTGTIATPAVATLTPTIATITPNTGTVAGGTVVTITGTNFVEPLTGTGTGTRVRFGTLDAASVTVINSTTLTATTPAAPGAGAVDVVVSNHHIDPAWAPVTSTGGFTYTATPPPPPPPANPPPLPDVRAQIEQWTNERPDLFARQCEAGVKYVNSPWQDFIVDRLRQIDPRWGYNGKPTRTAADNGGRPVVAAGDELAYFYGTGNPQGSTDVYLVDILFGHCGPSPSVTWRVFTGEEPGFWTGAGRF